jgi:predicted transcriptional regulator
LARLGTEPGATPLHQPVVGAVSLRKSLASPEHIVSMIDGKPYRLLKRHLSQHGLTPHEYRIRCRLPSDYPMIAPAYNAERSAMAKRLGLGRKPAATPAPSRRKLKIATHKDG